MILNQLDADKIPVHHFFFRGVPVPPIVRPDTPIGEAVQPIEGRSTRSLSILLDRGRVTNASLQTEAQKKPVPPIEITEAYGPPIIWYDKAYKPLHEMFDLERK